MRDIVFSDSACGSLKEAQHFGEGKYCGEGIGIFFDNEDATEEEVMQAGELEIVTQAPDLPKHQILAQDIGAFCERKK